MDLQEGCYTVTAVVETLFCESEEELQDFSGDSESSTGSTSNEVHSHTDTDADKANSVEPLPELLEVQGSSNGWTNDKHVSYLKSMEEAFIKKLYGRKYCAVDICGEQPSQQEKTLNSSSKVFRSWLEKAIQQGAQSRATCRRCHVEMFNKKGTM